MKNTSLVETLSDEIVGYIINNDLKPGDRLPNEYGLSEIFGAGRSTIREAIKSLTSRNILEVRRGAGTFVSPQTGVADDPLGFTFVKDKLRLARDLLEIRFLLEPRIAALAAANATKTQAATLDRLCEETEALIRAGVDHGGKDTAFHTQLALCSENLVVPNLIPIINSSIGVFIELTNHALLEETILDHREITNAVRNHEPIKAQDAMYLHLVHNRRMIEALAEKR